ncbi:hypothetical protein [Spirosoma radiotolerans]|uniref:Uncharacterized protein n=1 Tax=Spirosoma radiotolerans TaxID=1379870 RepID=A0A0E3ZV08_9BACT|nr:hypothetical protein [Spirosoma radiotolerans]AKD54838.1 hypothetical protein SD10_07880 [Spirosoma radiotolerans]
MCSLPSNQANLAIQRYNTLGLAHNLLHYNKTGSDGSALAERNLLKARQVALSYGDSLSGALFPPAWPMSTPIKRNGLMHCRYTEWAMT